MDSLLGIIIAIVFLWITTRSLKWLFVSAIIVGILFIIFSDRVYPEGYGVIYGIVFIVGGLIWLFIIRSMDKK